MGLDLFVDEILRNKNAGDPIGRGLTCSKTAMSKKQKQIECKKEDVFFHGRHVLGEFNFLIFPSDFQSLKCLPESLALG